MINYNEKYRNYPIYSASKDPYKVSFDLAFTENFFFASQSQPPAHPPVFFEAKNRRPMW